MKIPALGVRQWKMVLCAALLLLGSICVLAIANWQQLLSPGIAAEVRFSTGNLVGARAKLKTIEPGSQMAMLGAKTGDMITYDNIGDGWRMPFATGDRVGLTIGEDSARRHVFIEARPKAHLDPGTSVFYVLVLINSIVALTLAALIGWRRAASPSARLLALIVMIEASFANQFLPGGALTAFAYVVLAPCVGLVAFCGFFLFTCLFPNDDVSHVPRWVRWTSVPVILCYCVYNLIGLAVRAGWMAVPKGMPDASLPVMLSLIFLFSGVNLWHAYRRSSGMARQRIQWVGVATAVRFASYVAVTLPGMPYSDSVAFAEGQIVLTILANIALAYAILRHRVFDVGFAVNRALVYTIVSVVLLVTFGLMEWLAHHFVSPEEAEKNAFLDAGIALGLYLVFHRLRHFVDHFVDRMFFHKWHANEERLRRFVKHAAHITSPQVLIGAYLSALQHFSGAAGCAVYRRERGDYALTASAGLAAPQLAGIDDPLAVALRAEQAPAAPAECASSLPGALALPMRFRGELQGFVLLGQKPSGDAYRPDEIAVLEHAAHQVGLDLQALRTEQLQLEVAGLRQELAAYGKGVEGMTGASAVRM